MKFIYLTLICFILFHSCKKETGTLQTVEPGSFVSLETGKYIRYRLDSTVFVHFGQKDTVISYDAKDVVESESVNEEGEKTFTVVRYLRDINSTDETDYKPRLTYTISPSREAVVISENNLRYQKLRLPVTEGFSWRGNSYLPSTPFYELYQFSNDEDMGLWDYTYQDVYQPAVVNDNIYDSTITILQVDDSQNVPIEYPDGLAYKNFWLEQYAINIGLIYKEVEMWEYQPPNSSSPGFRSGFGLRMTIIDHN